MFMYFNPTPLMVAPNNIVYSDDLNTPLLAIDVAFDMLIADIRTSMNITCGADTGVANTYVINLNPAITSYEEGLTVWLKPLHENTDSSTLNVNGLGPIEIQKVGQLSVVAGELVANYFVGLKYNDGKFQIFSNMSDVAAANSAAAAAKSAAAAAIALASANLKGDWLSLSGGYAKPTSVYHVGEYWMLLNDIADIAASEPGVSADWAKIDTGTIDTIVGTAGEIEIDDSAPRNPVIRISPDFITELPKIADKVTGNIQGLEFSYNDTDTIDFKKGNCYDSLGTTLLILSADTACTIVNPAINETYFAFLTDAGDIQFDLEKTGATLLADSVSQLRRLAYVCTDPSGNILPFVFYDETLEFLVIGDTPIIQTSNTSFIDVPASKYLPIDMIKSWLPGILAHTNTASYPSGINLRYKGYNALIGQVSTYQTVIGADWWKCYSMDSQRSWIDAKKDLEISTTGPYPVSLLVNKVRLIR